MKEKIDKTAFDYIFEGNFKRKNDKIICWVQGMLKRFMYAKNLGKLFKLEIAWKQKPESLL